MKSMIISPAHNLEASRLFYNNLQFQHYLEDGKHYYSDGKVIIHLDTRKSARPGIIFFLKEDSKIWNIGEKWASIDGIKTGNDPNGIFMYLDKIENYPDVHFAENPSIIGQSVGLSIESLSYKNTAEFWEQFGYVVTMGGLDQGWLQMENNTQIGLGIMKYGMCPHSFRNPSLTYFNGKENLETIKKVRESGVSITEEITLFNDQGIVDNIILTDHGGYGFFVFSD